MKRPYGKGMGRGYRGPLRWRRKKRVPEPVLIMPEPPVVPLTAREREQQTRIQREIEACKRRLAASDRIHRKDG